jgi:hypothetical protein
MKKQIIYIAALLISTLVFACKKNGIHEIETVKTDGAAQVKFYNFGINSPTVNFYANGNKISAIVSATGAEAATGIAYGSVFPATNYSLLSGGAYTFTGIVPALAAVSANAEVVNIKGSIENGKFYSVYSCGILNTVANTLDGFIVEDKIPAEAATPATVANVRFVNTISNGTAGFDLIAKNTTTLTEVVVATNVSYKGASEFAQIPAGVYELYARYTGSPANIISRSGTSTVSFIKGRTYTVSSRGDVTVTGTTAINRPFLDNTSNRP